MPENQELNWQLVEDLTVRATYYNKLGLFFHRKGEYPKALENFKAALLIAEQLGDMDGEVAYLNNIGGVNKVLGNNIEALKQFQAITKIAKKLGDLSLEATYLNRMGLIYHDQGNHFKELEQYKEALKLFQEAMKCYKTTLKIAGQLGDKNKKMIAINNIAGIYNVQGNYPKALKYYEDALTLLTELGLKDSLEAEKIRKNVEIIKGTMKKGKP
ncbi:MAG: tetratricopeptide repeat protein [Candidatus Helarchaeota archaeon]|nr:tetratricopeptide repeat protein [Candidatus Helarchaeota archaeon]